jgi:hypothetical protein
MTDFHQPNHIVEPNLLGRTRLQGALASVQ